MLGLPCSAVVNNFSHLQNRPRGTPLGCPFYILLSRDYSLSDFIPSASVLDKGPIFSGPLQPRTPAQICNPSAAELKEAQEKPEGGPAAN